MCAFASFSLLALSRSPRMELKYRYAAVPCQCFMSCLCLVLCIFVLCWFVLVSFCKFLSVIIRVNFRT